MSRVMKKPTFCLYRCENKGADQIFNSCKMVILNEIFVTFFLLFAQNIDPEAILRSTYNLMFRAKMRQQLYTSVNPSLTI